jgi:hypothetical protein
VIDTIYNLWSDAPHESHWVIRSKEVYGSGFIEIVIWQVPEPIPPSEHPYKYRLAYVLVGQRLVGYDNERGKSDHRHIGNGEIAYRFVNPQQLMADFLADVKGASK